MLSTPPAFILSQDQTLVKSVCTQSRIAWQFCCCLLFWFDIFRCPFLKNLFKEFSGFVVYCSVINVLFVVAVSCDSFYIISKCFMFVNNFFKLFFVAFFESLKQQLWYIIIYLLVCQQLFWSFFKSYFQTKRRKRDSNPRAGCPTYTLSRGASSASWVFLRIS